VFDHEKFFTDAGYIEHISESTQENLSPTRAKSLVSYVGDRLKGLRVTVNL
jgi:hypothetical protein